MARVAGSVFGAERAERRERRPGFFLGAHDQRRNRVGFVEAGEFAGKFRVDSEVAVGGEEATNVAVDALALGRHHEHDEGSTPAEEAAGGTEANVFPPEQATATEGDEPDVGIDGLGVEEGEERGVIGPEATIDEGGAGDRGARKKAGGGGAGEDDIDERERLVGGGAGVVPGAKGAGGAGDDVEGVDREGTGNIAEGGGAERFDEGIPERVRFVRGFGPAFEREKLFSPGERFLGEDAGDVFLKETEHSFGRVSQSQTRGDDGAGGRAGISIENNVGAFGLPGGEDRGRDHAPHAAPVDRQHPHGYLYGAKAALRVGPTVDWTSVQRFAIAVAGMSGSGKTTLAEALASALDAALLRTDDYYRPLDHLTFEERCDVNYDHPDSVDGARLANDLRRLLAGEAIEVPAYDFSRHTWSREVRVVQPRPAVLIEGIFALSYKELRDLCAVKVFLDTDEQTCLQRRMERDVLERGRTPGEVISRFEGHVAPMFRQHVLPSRKEADVRVSGDCPGRTAVEAVLAATPAYTARV